MGTLKKIFLSSVSGLVMLIITYCYINSNFTISAEDSLYKNISFYAFKLFGIGKPDGQDEVRFINTAHNLALIQDTAGVTAITDRRKLSLFLEELYKYNVQPKFIIIDLQLYSPFIEENEKQGQAGAVDQRLQKAIKKFDRLSTPVLLDKNDHPLRPLIVSENPGVTTFNTYGDFLTKFQLSYDDGKISSIPLLLYQRLSNDKFNDYRTSRGKIGLNNISPYFYFTDGLIAETPNLDDVAEIGATEYKSYNGKIIFIGNFDSDKVQTAIGELPGTVVLANIYLTLRNGHYLISSRWFFLVFIVLTLLSYLAWFKKMPKIKLPLKMFFSPQISKFLNNYCSYLGAMLALSLVSFLVFHIYVNILFLSFLFSTIEFFTNKDYSGNNE